MIINKVLFTAVLLLMVDWSFAEVEIRQTYILSIKDQQNLRIAINNNQSIKQHFETIVKNAEEILLTSPQPLVVINYEGLLDTDSLRKQSESCLKDMDRIALLLFAYYGSGSTKYRDHAIKYIIEWANTFLPTGNPINENKLEPLIHAYYVFRSFLSRDDCRGIDRWLLAMARKEIKNENIPNNNWRSKQIKTVGTIGYILNNQTFINFAKMHFRDYIDRALFDDGSSSDLHHRDALSYHVSGLRPLLVYGLLVDYFEPDSDFKPFEYLGLQSGSVEKSMDFVVPYATGQKEYRQWRNSKVKLDRERADAGITKYQPGTLYNPRASLEAFEMAWYFKKEYDIVLECLKEGGIEKPSWNFALISLMGT